MDFAYALPILRIRRPALYITTGASGSSLRCVAGVTCRANQLREFLRCVVRQGPKSAPRSGLREDRNSRAESRSNRPFRLRLQVFACAFPKIMIYLIPSRANQRGVLANRHETWVRGMQWTSGCRVRKFSRADERHLADGETVWSWRPWAGAKVAGDEPATDGDYEVTDTGESTSISRKPLRREGRRVSADPW